MRYVERVASRKSPTVEVATWSAGTHPVVPLGRTGSWTWYQPGCEPSTRNGVSWPIRLWGDSWVTTLALAFGWARATIGLPWAVATVELTGMGTAAVWVGAGRSLAVGVGEALGDATAPGLGWAFLGLLPKRALHPMTPRARRTITLTIASACVNGWAFASRDRNRVTGVLRGGTWRLGSPRFYPVHLLTGS